MTVTLRFDKGDGLVPAIAQDYQTGTILMMAYINEESWKLSLETGIVHYWSRSRNKLWKKGESSGNVQEIKEIFIDCDEDTVLFKVNQIGKAACHEGYESCFFRKVTGDGDLEIVGSRVFDPKDVYG
jgi:phosphoribosyl-AMP cyclohydrolase